MTLIQQFTLPNMAVDFIFHPKDHKFIVMDADGVIYIYSLPDGDQLAKIAQHKNNPSYVDLALNPTGLLAISYVSGIDIWDTNTVKRVQQFKMGAESIEWFPDGTRLLLCNSGYGTDIGANIRILDTKTGNITHRYRYNKAIDGIQAVTIHPDGSQFIIGGSLYDSQVILYNISQETPANILQLTRGAGIIALCFLSHTDIAILSEYGHLQHWDITNQTTHVLFEPQRYTADKQIHFSIDHIATMTQNAQYIAYGKQIEWPFNHPIRGTPYAAIHLASIKSQQNIAIFELHAETLSALSISPDNRWMLSGDFEGQVGLWRLPPIMKI